MVSDEGGGFAPGVEIVIAEGGSGSKLGLVRDEGFVWGLGFEVDIVGAL